MKQQPIENQEIVDKLGDVIYKSSVDVYGDILSDNIQEIKEIVIKDFNDLSLAIRESDAGEMDNNSYFVVIKTDELTVSLSTYPDDKFGVLVCESDSLEKNMQIMKKIVLSISGMNI